MVCSFKGIKYYKTEVDHPVMIILICHMGKNTFTLIAFVNFTRKVM